MNRQFLALRGVAITLVVLHHAIALGIQASQNAGFSYIAWWEYIPLVIMKNLGIFAVPTFLFISGSFFAYTARGQDQNVSYKVVWSGLKNILPPYCLWSIAFYILVYFLLDQKFTAWEYVKSLLVGYPYHFIPLIAFYYLISPFVVRLSRHYAWIVLLVIGLYQMFSLSVVYPSNLGINYPGWVRYLTLPVLRETMATWGIYFPMGVVFSLHSKEIFPFLQKYWMGFIALALAFLSFAILNETSMLVLPIAGYIAPFFFIFVVPVIQRQSIPWLRQFERIGKKAYGLYLTHLLMVNLVLAGIQFIAPWAISILLMTIPLSFLVALSIPLWVMDSIERLPRLNIYRYVFG
jgi:peptidoglycan/LPS O-acetylase OafA/YrhL